MRKKFHIQKRSRRSHKGDYGHVFVIAGSLGMTGAAFLCAEAACLAGAGLVTLAIPQSLNGIVAKMLVEVMTLPLPETKQKTLSRNAYQPIFSFVKRCSAVAIGPGLSRNSQTQALIRALIRDISIPLVIDADGLNALIGNTDILKKSSPVIITPHAGEMARLFGTTAMAIENKRKTLAKAFAHKYNVTVVLKGNRSIVASPESIYINTTGNPGMASGGCGDVLTGIIAALLAGGMEPFKAARLGVYVHGLSGDIAAVKKGEVSLRARDLLENMPYAFKKVYG